MFLEFGRHTYSEVTPSGAGCRIWGLANGAALHRKFTLEIDGKEIAVELFRRTRKALTITGYRLDTIRELTGIDKVLDWGVIWGERRKAAAAAAAPVNGHTFNGNGSGYSVDQIEQIVRTGAPEGANRSDVFHTVVGHYLGCGWTAEQILAHLQQFPQGISERYLREDRLHREIARSASKYAAAELPLSAGWVDGWEAKAPLQPEPEVQPGDDPELEEPLEPELQDELDDEEPPEQQPDLPPMYAHGDPDPRPLKSWLVKHLIPECGHGLLSGQWGAGKTFVVFDLAAALGTGQPFLGYAVKRQCGVLLIAAEGGDEVRLRLDAVVRAKCGGLARAPFRWYETAPMLLQKGATEKLIAMARQAEASLLQEFGLPLGLIAVDTIAACAGYSQPGAENDNAVGQAIMNVLKAVARAIGCFVLGVDHFGKDLQAGTRGASQQGKLRRPRAGLPRQQGALRQRHQYPAGGPQAPRRPAGPGIPVRAAGGGGAGARRGWRADHHDGGGLEPDRFQGTQSEPDDPWAKPKRQDQRTAALRLKRVLMTILAEQGVDLPIAPDGPVVRMVDQELVRKAFYACTPAEGTPEQKRQLRSLQFKRALGWAEDQQLIGIEEIDGVTYLRLSRPDREEEENE